MQKLQQGFNIIELMIVVAVIGVLATIMLPMYSDYQTRAKVSEAMLLLGGLKAPMVDYYTTWGVWPSVSRVGGKTTGIYTSTIESKTDTWASPSGTISTYVEATMRGPGPLGGLKIRMGYNTVTRDWFCSTSGIADAIPDKLLPSSCR